MTTTTTYIDYLKPALRRFAMYDKDAMVIKREFLGMLGNDIIRLWDELEEQAALHGYNAFLIPNAKEVFSALVELLYMLPDARVESDEEQIRYKDREYGGSWLARGGIGAFFAAARKPDRIKTQLKRYNGDLKIALEVDDREEGILDDLGDLRRYLILWLAHLSHLEAVNE